MKKVLEAAVVLTAYDKMTQKVKGVLNNVTKQYEASRARIQRMNSIADSSMLAGAAATAAFVPAINAAEEAEIAFFRLDRVFKSMGDTTGQAARESAAYASKLQTVIGIEDEHIMAVQAKLATFGKVSNAMARANGTFERATKLAFDLQATGFGEASANAVQLGKALQDPVKGINALRKAGISFTDAERLKIKVLTESGKLTKAQEIILKAIEKQVGGVAEATAPASAKMKVAFGEIGESIGKVLLPSVQKFQKMLANNLLPKITQFIDKHPKLVKWLAMGAMGLLAFGVALKVVTTIMAIFNAVAALNPITWIVVAIFAAIAAVTILVWKWKELVAWWKNSSLAMKILLAPLMLSISAFIWVAKVIRTVIDNWDSLVSKVQAGADMFKKAFAFTPMGIAVNGISSLMNMNSPTTGASASPTAGLSPVTNNGGSSVTYAPQVSIMGGSPSAKQDFAEMLRQHKNELMNVINDSTSRKMSRQY